MIDAESFGITLADEQTRIQQYELWPEHWPAVELFMRCFTQWRSGPSGLMGLDYNVVIQLAKLYDVENLPCVLEEIQVMELHARNQINDRIAKEQRH